MGYCQDIGYRANLDTEKELGALFFFFTLMGNGMIRKCHLVSATFSDTLRKNQPSEMVWLTTPFPLGMSAGCLCWVLGGISVTEPHYNPSAPQHAHSSDIQHLQRLTCVSGVLPPEIQCLV